MDTEAWGDAPLSAELVDDTIDTWEAVQEDWEEDIFRPLTDLLSDSLLASCLLGMDHVHQTTVRRPSTAAFQDPVETAFNVPPKEAIDYFQAKKVLKSSAFKKLAKEAKSSAFSVGGVYREDVLQGFKDELHRSMKEGHTQAQTIKRFHDILSGAGHRQLGEFHLETVFRTNMQTAYGVGRRQALEEVKEDLPFWTRHAVMDDRTRPRHAALDGVTLPANHEFWNTHFAPDDFNCRCSVTAGAEIPAGYDPKNPSGLLDEHGEPLVDISYDDQGMPAKAEIGTTLYDLQVGNFNGIPPHATLQSAIEAGVARARKAR
jgi:SPP1 gp7 family putative phage head morphogenesis protein